MSNDSDYTDKIRQLTTAAEKDDAKTAAKVLEDLGPERWENSVKEVLAMNQKDLKEKHYTVFIPFLSAELDKKGSTEALTIYQQPDFHSNAPLAVATVEMDISANKIGNPIDPKVDLARQLTNAAEEGNAVKVARIFSAIGPENWGEESKKMLALNIQDRIQWRKNHPDQLGYGMPYLSVGYETHGQEQTIKIFQSPRVSDLPLAKVTERK
jgi:hypothetical protein